MCQLHFMSQNMINPPEPILSRFLAYAEKQWY